MLKPPPLWELCVKYMRDTECVRAVLKSSDECKYSYLWKTACDIWEIIDTAFPPLLAASLPAALHFPRSDPACADEVLFTRLSSERSDPESEQAMNEIRWRSCHPSHCLDQDTNLTFNSKSASTSYQSVGGSAAHVACSSECVYTRQMEERDREKQTHRKPLTANTYISNM